VTNDRANCESFKRAFIVYGIPVSLINQCFSVRTCHGQCRFLNCHHSLRASLGRVLCPQVRQQESTTPDGQEGPTGVAPRGTGLPLPFPLCGDQLTVWKTGTPGDNISERLIPLGYLLLLEQKQRAEGGGCKVVECQCFQNSIFEVDQD